MARLRTKRPTGGWLVTYADLMTILVCFFVLIISYSIQDQVKMEVVAGSMRDAFGVAEQRRFAGDIRLDGTPEERQPGNIRPTQMPSANGIAPTLSGNPTAGDIGIDAASAEAAAQTRKRQRDTQQAIEKAILTHPLLKDQADAITVNLVDDGLQVILPEQTGAPMFELGSASPTLEAQGALSALAAILAPLPNRIFIEGHADATGAGAYSAFSLTAARANAAREIMEGAGFPADRIAGISGRAAAQPLFPENPYAAGNRRIEILLEPAAPLLPPERSL